MAVETLGRFTQDEINYIRETSLIIGELDWNTGMHDAKREGLFEGLNKGREEEKFDIARKMKVIGFLADQIQAVMRNKPNNL